MLKEKRKKYSREWYLKNKDVVLARSKLRYASGNKPSPEYVRNITKEQHKRNLATWIGYIPEETSCQICGKTIYFNSNSSVKSIHFDHRNGGVEKISGSPKGWLRFHKRTPENQKIWEECNFGMLCRNCNVSIPTKDRELFLEKLTRYIKNAG